MFEFRPLEIPEVIEVKPRRFSDNRGMFWEIYAQAKFRAAGIDAEFVQDNQSYSRSKGTVRGLHAQAPPFAQAKLVRVLRGAILDVAVDIRTGSESYGKWVSLELSAGEANCLFVPRGFLHGFVTLEDHTEVTYKVDNPYDSECEFAVAWNDPGIAVFWNIDPAAVALSDKDASAPFLKDIRSPF